jgi:hypothetical protein
VTTTWQVTVDCADPGRLAPFWALALRYEIEPPPDGFASWNEFYRSIGVPEDELNDEVDAADSLIDPSGRGPRIWFQQVPEAKVIKNRLHFDLKVSGGRAVPLEQRRLLVDAEVERLVAAGATVIRSLAQDGLDHYGVTLADPEGNEFCVA